MHHQSLLPHHRLNNPPPWHHQSTYACGIRWRSYSNASSLYQSRRSQNAAQDLKPNRNTVSKRRNINLAHLCSLPTVRVEYLICALYSLLVTPDSAAFASTIGVLASTLPPHSPTAKNYSSPSRSPASPRLSGSPLSPISRSRLFSSPRLADSNKLRNSVFKNNEQPRTVEKNTRKATCNELWAEAESYTLANSDLEFDTLVECTPSYVPPKHRLLVLLPLYELLMVPLSSHVYIFTYATGIFYPSRILA